MSESVRKLPPHASFEQLQKQAKDLLKDFYAGGSASAERFRAVNPDAALARVAREEGWEIMRFDRLGRRLRLAAGAATIALLGVGGGYLGPRVWRHVRD